jgi:hypothetical protein
VVVPASNAIYIVQGCCDHLPFVPTDRALFWTSATLSTFGFVLPLDIVSIAKFPKAVKAKA